MHRICRRGKLINESDRTCEVLLQGERDHELFGLFIRLKILYLDLEIYDALLSAADSAVCAVAAELALGNYESILCSVKSQLREDKTVQVLDRYGRAAHELDVRSAVLARYELREILKCCVHRICRRGKLVNESDRTCEVLLQGERDYALFGLFIRLNILYLDLEIYDALLTVADSAVCALIRQLVIRNYESILSCVKSQLREDKTVQVLDRYGRAAHELDVRSAVLARYELREILKCCVHRICRRGKLVNESDRTVEVLLQCERDHEFFGLLVRLKILYLDLEIYDALLSVADSAVVAIVLHLSKLLI